MKRDEWAKQIEDWKRSGLEAADYGKRYGIAPKKLYWWSWYLRAHRTRAERATAKTALVPIPRASLLPVRLRQSTARTGSAPGADASGGACVDVALPSGAVIRAPSSVDPVWLGRVIVAGTGSC
jgi:hypothetical protein